MQARYNAPYGTVIADTSKGKTTYAHLDCFVASYGVHKTSSLTTGLVRIPGHQICETFLYKPATCSVCCDRMEVVR